LRKKADELQNCIDELDRRQHWERNLYSTRQNSDFLKNLRFGSSPTMRIVFWVVAAVLLLTLAQPLYYTLRGLFVRF